MNILLIAEEAAGAHALRCLELANQRIVAVLTSGRVTDPRSPTVRELAQRAGIPVWPVSLARDPAFAGRVRSEDVDILLNVQSLTIVNSAVLQALRIGGFNLHPGPLPAYAGLNVVSWSILRGETTHASTLHWMDAAVDSGPVAYQSCFAISDSDSALTLYAKCVSAGMPLIEALLHDATLGAIPAIAQDRASRRWYGNKVPFDGCLRWTRTAQEICNFVRACDYLPFRSPWGHPRARVRNIEFVIMKAVRTFDHAGVAPGTVGARMGRSVCVATADEWLLVNRVGIEGHDFDAADLLHEGDVVHDGAATPAQLAVRQAILKA